MDIEAINNEHNTITRLQGVLDIDGDFGVVQYDGENVEVWLPDPDIESVILTVDDAMQLGAALLTIAKEDGAK